VEKGGGKSLADLIALVRHAIDPETIARPVARQVEERFAFWLQEKQDQGIEFNTEQLEWLKAIRDHIARALAITAEDFDEVPFSRQGGLGMVVQLFGEGWKPLLAELNERLVA